MRKLQSGKYFTSTAPQPIEGVIYDNGHWFIESVERGEAIDEYGNVDPGFVCEAHKATEEEIAAWKDARRKHRAGRTVWQMIEDHTTER